MYTVVNVTLTIHYFLNCITFAERLLKYNDGHRLDVGAEKRYPFMNIGCFIHL